LSDETLDAANQRLNDAVNQSGDVFISPTKLRGRVSLRIAVGHLHTQEQHIRRVWELLLTHAGAP
jgi:aromatic-L-amino-acid decarboxylase